MKAAIVLTEMIDLDYLGFQLHDSDIPDHASNLGLSGEAISWFHAQ